MKHPNQPLVVDAQGCHRFKKNEIVEFLLDRGGFDMNDLAALRPVGADAPTGVYGGRFYQEDWEQFAQLIGYSLDGFAELSYARSETLAAVAKENSVEAGALGVLEQVAHRLREPCTLEDARAAFSIAVKYLNTVKKERVRERHSTQ